jgi:predicted O-methyltransferase YrrM
MLDTVRLNPPEIIQEIEAATKVIGFTMGSDLLTGSLLRLLVTSKPAGSILELGTGTGLATAWLLDGMDARSSLVTVERNENTAAIAKRFLGGDSRVTFHAEDGMAFIQSLSKEEKTFDLIFADMSPGKYEYLELTLQLLKPGGLYVVDDMLIQTSWNEDYIRKVCKLVAVLEQRKDMRTTKLNWSSGIILSAKVSDS